MGSKIKVENDIVTVACPNCGMWEEIHVDEQRHHLQSFDIVSWASENPDVSITECGNCNTRFSLTWIYPD